MKSFKISIRDGKIIRNKVLKEAINFFYDNFSVPREDALLAALHTKKKIQKFSNFPFREFLFPVELQNFPTPFMIQLSTKVCPNDFVVLSHKVSREVSITEVFNLRY